MEALYALQAEEATALRGEIRSVVAVLEAHNKRQDELLKLRKTADHQIFAAVQDLTEIADALKALAVSADTMPERVQSVLNSADVTAIHKKLADALTVDIWAKLDANSDSESKRVEETFMRLERRVNAAVANIRDAHLGKPSLPTAAPSGPLAERVMSRVYRAYIHVLRACAEVHQLAATFALASVGLAAVATMIRQLVLIAAGN
ncbi:hypothetical protein QZM25_28335 [Burkholderia contaminans]|uniref:hypothetical protein n=1 Tax=Burkholderia cepacia complex TaxID=87882 RepID=UPI001CF4545D|nr:MULTISPECIES: hypothetical protein [Burkholderia cepacia complex]MCA7888849.1 hypothetical protein [Burkholderia contaminans]MDN7576526.1 hypothetical protein [Burkholderia contaminans]